ncbi:hypothetical protein, partial [Acidaminococcus massiliensis]|uniref:hypothetical protein n=1 Tax=Acidaminococcus massiliensis TaxID=1852375 RepID=UPI00266C4CCD
DFWSNNWGSAQFSHMQQLSFFFSFKVFNEKSKKYLKFPKIEYNNVSRPFWRLFSCHFLVLQVG